MSLKPHAEGWSFDKVAKTFKLSVSDVSKEADRLEADVSPADRTSMGTLSRRCRLSENATPARGAERPLGRRRGANYPARGRRGDRPEPSTASNRPRRQQNVRAQFSSCRAGRHKAGPADHRRRHRRLQIARSHPPVEGARHCRALHFDESRRAICHPTVGGCACRRARVHRPVRPAGEFDVGHIRLARESDLIVVAPATADLMAKLAGGHADDLATTVLLATTAKILLAPAMNPRMWATRRRSAIWRSSLPMALRSRSERRRDGGERMSAVSAGWQSRWRSQPQRRNFLRRTCAQPLEASAC